jgi:tRNA-uridine 2-sulfurtransferase
METVGADVLATGHYARVEALADGAWALRRAVDADKDQSYALALIPYGVLSRVRFPLGGLRKEAVREHGRRLALSLWDKPESQDLCFVPDGDYAGFMVNALGETRGTAPGPFVTRGGDVLGTHRGVIHYTVGQRRGLGMAAAEPLYVLEIDTARNAVVVGPRSALESPGLVTDAVNWLLPRPPAGATRVEVKVRYHHAAAAARLKPLADGGAEVRFDTPQAAVTPGQLAVFYEGDRVIGGASIRCPLGADDRAAPSGVACVPTDQATLPTPVR